MGQIEKVENAHDSMHSLEDHIPDLQDIELDTRYLRRSSEDVLSKSHFGCIKLSDSPSVAPLEYVFSHTLVEWCWNEYHDGEGPLVFWQQQA